MDKLPERIRIKDIARLAEVSVGTVDRVLHNRPGVSPSSKERVEKILRELDYHPNMYASALASNKKYLFICMLPEHKAGSYWCDIEKGVQQAASAYSDFHISIEIFHYNLYDPDSFEELGDKVAALQPDGVVLSPTSPEKTSSFVGKLKAQEIPFVFIDSNMTDLNPLAFFGQHSMQSGYFAGSMLTLLAKSMEEVVIFRHISHHTTGLMNQQSRREAGFRNYMEKHHPHCRILELDVHITLRQEEVWSLLDDFFAAHPDIKAGLTFNSQVGVFGEYIMHRGLSDFKLLGYDLLERNVKCLRNGAVDFLIAQYPITQGYSCIDGLCKHLILRKEIKQFNYMPIDLLTPDNIDYYRDAEK